MKQFYSIFILFIYLFFNFEYIHSLSIHSFDLITPNSGYQNSNGKCEAKAVDLAGCSVDQAVFTGDYVKSFRLLSNLGLVYYEVDFNFPYGKTHISLYLECGVDVTGYFPIDIYNCTSPPSNQIVPNQLIWSPTFPQGFSGFQSHQKIFLTNYRYQTFPSCSTSCYTYLIPNSALLCKSSTFDLQLNVNDTIHTFSYYDEIFNDSSMKVNGNLTYPNTSILYQYSYLASSPLWYSVSLTNVSQLISTESLGRTYSELFPISGNKKSATFINAIKLGQYSQFDIRFNGKIANFSVIGSTFNFSIENEIRNVVVGGSFNSIAPGYSAPLFDFFRSMSNQLSSYVVWSTDNFIYSRYDYPYGYCDYTITNSLHKSVHLTGNISDSIPFLQFMYTDLQKIPITTYQGSTLYTSIKYITLLPFGTYQYIIDIDVSDQLYGIFKIFSGNCEISDRDLVVGTDISGLYSKVCPLEYSDGKADLDLTIRVYSKAMTHINVTTNNYIPFTKIFFPRFKYQFVIPLSEFINVSFLYNNLNVTNKSAITYFVFKLRSGIQSFKPILEILNADFNGNRKQFVGQWDEFYQFYVIPVEVPMNYFEGLVPYRLLTLPRSISNVEFSSIFNNSQLYIESNNADMIGPMVSSINKIVNLNSIVWEITLEDEINGIKEAYVNITSNIDPHKPTRINLPVSGKVYSAVYPVEYLIIDVTQTLSLSLWAIDNGGNEVSSYILDQENSIISTTLGNRKRQFIYPDPFMKLANKEELIYHVHMKSTNADINSPILKSFNIIPLNIDVGIPSTITLLNFSISDSNIQETSNPIIYISSLYDQTIEFPTKILSVVNDTITYGCDAIFPYGFGSSEFFLISIYGIRDFDGNLLGMTSLDLKTKGYKYTINRLFSRKPFLERHDPISSNGGLLTVYGYNFELNQNRISLTIQYPSFKNQIIPLNDVLNYSKTFFIFKAPSFNEGLNYTLIFSYGNFSTNLIIQSYILSPIQTMTPTVTQTATPPVTILPTFPPKKCPGSTKECSGNGDCINSECQCYRKWFGPDCQSELIPVQPPVVNPIIPSTNTTIVSPTKNFLVSEVAISSIREIDQIGTVITEFNLTITQWYFTNNTKEQDKFIEYQYSTRINNNQTDINVTIQYFSKEFNFSFAGDSYIMSPSSIKYSIKLSQYDFKSQLHSLQVILSATISGNQSECSSKSFGPTSTILKGEEEIKWIKLKVGYESLYGRFLEKAIIDSDRVIRISNILLDDKFQSISTTSSAQSYIGMNIPYFESNAHIDPDFSILIDHTSASEESNSQCNRKSKKLSNSQIAGIVIAAVVVLISVIGATIYIKYKTKKRAKALKNIEMKLGQLKD